LVLHSKNFFQPISLTDQRKRKKQSDIFFVITFELGKLESHSRAKDSYYSVVST